MRISDWSSDVCSSDLRGNPCRRSAGWASRTGIHRNGDLKKAGLWRVVRNAGSRRRDFPIRGLNPEECSLYIQILWTEQMLLMPPYKYEKKGQNSNLIH